MCFEGFGPLREEDGEGLCGWEDPVHELFSPGEARFWFTGQAWNS